MLLSELGPKHIPSTPSYKYAERKALFYCFQTLVYRTRKYFRLHTMQINMYPYPVGQPDID